MGQRVGERYRGRGVRCQLGNVKPTDACRHSRFSAAPFAFYDVSMALLSVANLVFAYGEQRVLDGVNLTLQRGERVGLIGRNGCGKSTLMALVLGRAGLQPTGGQLQVARGATVGMLTQDFQLNADLTLRDEAGQAFAELEQLHKKMEQLTHAMADAEASEQKRLLREYEAIEHQMHAAGGYAVDHQIESTLHGLGLTDDLFHVRVGDLSGGQKGRLSLAKLLLSRPDILLLDEPTNHLDIAGRQWLETYLSTYAGAVLLVSHDRWLLDRAVTRICELEGGELVEFPGNYQAYRELRAERYLAQERAYDKQQTKIRHEQEFIARYRAGQRSKQARGRESRLERYKQQELLDRPTELDVMHVRFTVAKRAGDLVLTCDGISKGYESKPLFGPLSLVVKRGDRIGVIGPNGAGKSTLVRCLLGETECDAGRTRRGAQVSVGHYRQTHEELELGQTVVDYLHRKVPDALEQSARDLAGAFLFSGDQQDAMLADLSGGERSRAVLAGLMAGGYNLLVLDEPTNHLDIPSAERLEEALRRYTAPLKGFGASSTGGGTLLVITHDRMLLDHLVDQLIILDGRGGSRHFHGTYSEYLEVEARPAIVDESTREEGGLGRSRAKEAPARPKSRGTPRDKSSKPRRAKTSALTRLGTEQIEAKIMAIENELAEIDQQLTDPDIYSDPDKVQDRVARREKRAAELRPLEEEWARRASDED